MLLYKSTSWEVSGVLYLQSAIAGVMFFLGINLLIISNMENVENLDLYDWRIYEPCQDGNIAALSIGSIVYKQPNLSWKFY